MPTVPLPDDPSSAQLRKQAKELRDAARAGAPEARALFAEHHPDGALAPSLHAAQLVLARHYGFASWARLKHHLDVVERYTRTPDEMSERPDRADEFLRLACLRYGDGDEPASWEAARRLRAEHTDIGRTSIYTAAASSDPEAVRAHLHADPSLARRAGGPFDWDPLFYLAYARVDADVARDNVLDIARLLLDHGADPNAGYLWHGLPTPFTVLTGAFGEGELGPDRQPRHPHSFALADALLDAGADPNDGQALYNRQFRADDDHLVLLLARGLGTGDGGPWRRRLGDVLDSPAELVRGQLRWAAAHDMPHRVQLLVDSGVDFVSSFADGRTAAEIAALNGNRDIAEMLVSRGAARPNLAPADAFVAAALAGDRDGVDRLRRAHAHIVDDVRAARPGLVVWAAAVAPHDAVRLLVELGFDVDALGRSDVPVEQPWETALHHAAATDDVELAQLLLSLGADPGVHDRRFDNTPLGWAHHFGSDRVAELLAPGGNT